MQERRIGGRWSVKSAEPRGTQGSSGKLMELHKTLSDREFEVSD